MRKYTFFLSIWLVNTSFGIGEVLNKVCKWKIMYYSYIKEIYKKFSPEQTASDWLVHSGRLQADPVFTKYVYLFIYLFMLTIDPFP